ncbi:MAG: hypothetical protein ABWY82_07240 [Tardiphaga sp.]
MEIEAENLAADIMGAWAKKDHSKAELLKKAEASIAPARKFVDQLNHALREGTVELSARFGEWDAKEDAIYIPLNLFTPGGPHTITLKILESGFVDWNTSVRKTKGGKCRVADLTLEKGQQRSRG